MTAENKNLKKDYTSIFKIARAVVTTDVANDPRPFDMTRFDTHKKNIDTTLLAAIFQEIKPSLSVVGDLRTMVTAPATALITRSTRSSHSQRAVTVSSIICFCLVMLVTKRDRWESTSQGRVMCEHY